MPSDGHKAALEAVLKAMPDTPPPMLATSATSLPASMDALTEAIVDATAAVRALVEALGKGDAHEVASKPRRTYEKRRDALGIAKAMIERPDAMAVAQALGIDPAKIR